MNVIDIDHLGKCFSLKPFQRFPSLKDITQKILPFSSQSHQQEENFWAFRDVSFQVSKGERIGIIGPNGSGKTTLLRVLARIIAPSEGQARLRGRVGSIIEIGSGFHPELTGRENTFLSGVIMGMDLAYVKKKFDEIVDFSGVGAFIDMPVKYYSSGMYLRLAFSIIVHLDADLLFLDEVIAVGDELFQKRCYEKLKQLSEQGCTLLTVSHNLDMVAQFCNRVVLMKKGQVVLESSDVPMVIAQYKDNI